MRLASILAGDRPALAARREDTGAYVDVSAVDPSLGNDVGALLAGGDDWRARLEAALPSARPVEATGFRPLVVRPPKLLCLGLNDVDHANEGGFSVPEYPAVFARVASSLIGHRQPMLRPPESEQLDYEVELGVVVGRGGRRIEEANALSHVAGYTVFNDGTIRDYQRKTHQWTLGKNWHGTGALGPELVTADQLPPGAEGLELATHVGGERLQDGNTSRMVFSVARTIAILSEVLLLEPGDVIAMGTVRGVGHARTPPRWLRPGETVRASIGQIGTIENPIIDEVITEENES
jgi:2-keto-4-pentenoate hydratase/2-oxohepta-3-ene-1,7-dioic acid hydratase in catechol pathway